MANTSLGYHTFAFYQKLTADEYDDLFEDFKRYRRNNKDIQSFPLKDKNDHITGWEYAHKEHKGLRWILRSYSAENGAAIYYLYSIINPKAIENNYRYICASTEEDLKAIEKYYNREASNISIIIDKFGSHSVSRADYCLNIDLIELGFQCSPEYMMALIKKGDIPSHLSERRIYDEKQHRKITDKDSFYLMSNSVNINYYWKYPQQNDTNHPNYQYREISKNVIRFEVQCKYSKLYPMVADTKESSKYYTDTTTLSEEEELDRILYNIQNPSIPVDVVLRDSLADSVVRRYCLKTIRAGHYLTLEAAKEVIASYYFRRSKEERLFEALDLVKKYGGISKAKENLKKQELRFTISLNDLDEILINPVTIPRRWDIPFIPNPLRAYYKKYYRSLPEPANIKEAEQHIGEYLENKGQLSVQAYDILK